MAGVKLSKREYYVRLCKAFFRSFKRALIKNINRLTYSQKKIIKHTAGTVVLMVSLVIMAIPTTVAANNNAVYQSGAVVPSVTLTHDSLDAQIEDVEAFGVTFPETVSVIGNNGYPYAKAAEEGVTLAIRLADGVESATYQWQRSDDNSQWEDIPDATEEIFVNTNPKSGRWYRCVVNGEESKAVQVIGKFNCKGEAEKDSLDRIWTNPLMPYYISNGSVAYGISADGTKFDVVGLYNRGDKTYMLQTAYADGWSMVTSSSDAPAISHTAAQLDDLLISFAENDDNDLYIEADLASGETAFAFGCDTMLGNDATSNSHSDFAALEVNKKSDNTIDNISMVSAGSSSQSAGSNPGFVITPVTFGEIEFWLGHYNQRKYFNFNEGTGNITVDGEYIDNICTESLGIDSGMTMSWFNIPEGDSVKFMFSVGDAESIGVTYDSGNINYIAELIEGLKQNTDYELKIEGDDNTYLVRSNALGHITFKAVDLNGESYDLAGKNVRITKADSSDRGIKLSLNSRPWDVKEIPDSDEVVTIGDTSVTINIPLGSLQYFAQEYRIYDEFGKEIEGFQWTKLMGDGSLTFEGLQPDTVYSIKARISASEQSPASLISYGYRFRTTAN